MGERALSSHRPVGLLTTLHLCSVESSLNAATWKGSVLSFQPALAMEGPVQAELALKGFPSICSQGLVPSELPQCCPPAELAW